MADAKDSSYLNAGLAGRIILEMQMSQNIKTVVVLGMHRSGTSMVAGTLHRLGVFMGEQLPKGNWTNVYGHFEDRPFVVLNESILNLANGSWQSPPDRESILAVKDHINKDIQGLLSGGTCNLWGWKDPRTSLTIELFLRHLVNPHFIVCKRDAKMIAKSLRRRDQMGIETGIELTSIYNHRIEDFFKAHPGLPRLDIEYELITQDPDDDLQKMIEFLKLEVDQQTLQQARKYILPNEDIRKISTRLRFFKLLKQLRKKPTKTFKVIMDVIKAVRC